MGVRLTGYVYDIETYFNLFSAVFENLETSERHIFEISDDKSDALDLYWFLRVMESGGVSAIGFNNLYFDWPVLKYFMDMCERGTWPTAYQLYSKSQEIIGGPVGSIAHVDWRPRVRQVDLFKIHHFDNKAKTTSLKALEIAMRSEKVIDLPFSPHQPLNRWQKDEVIRYNCHDVGETKRFTYFSMEKINFRLDLAASFPGRDIINYNDTKIGKEYFIQELEAASPGITGTKSAPRQTPRNSISLAQIIFPYIQFEHPEFQRVLDHLRSSTITNTKAPPELKGLHATIDGFQFDFGTGGIHGSRERIAIREDDDHEIIDVDVASYYPNLAIKNRIFPAHLGERFCDIYAELYNQRKSHPKKSAPSEMLKLSLNGVYGDSNNIHGPFLDPAYTMTITVNGQLMICKLAEAMLKHPGIEIIQANTDGCTFRVHRSARPWFDAIYKWWQEWSCLELEQANYRSMFIRDVNSYIAVTRDGKRKRIGAYAHETAAENPATREVQWHKDPSALVVPKAAEAVMVDGHTVSDFVWRHADAWDFMMRAKAPRSSRLVITDALGIDHIQQNTLRYYITHGQSPLTKIMPELAKKPGSGERRLGINVGWSVAACNDIGQWDWEKLNRQFYIEEVEKLLVT